MATMTILSILLAVAFTAIVIWKMKGLPESISAMVYALPDGGWRWLWSAWLALLGILTFAPVVEMPETYFGGKGVLIAEVVCYVALVGALLCHYLS